MVIWDIILCNVFLRWINSSIQQIFIECLQHSRHYTSLWRYKDGEGKKLVSSYTISSDISQHICPVDKKNTCPPHKIWKIQRSIQEKRNILHGYINITFICPLMLFCISHTVLSLWAQLMFSSFLSIQVKTLHPNWVLEFTSTLSWILNGWDRSLSRSYTLGSQAYPSVCLSRETSLDVCITLSISSGCAGSISNPQSKKQEKLQTLGMRLMVLLIEPPE